MSKFFAFNPTTNQRTLRFVDQLDVANLQTDYPIVTPGGRLTLNPSASVADATNATALYYLPHAHNLIPIWDSSLSAWRYWAIPDAATTMTSLNSLTAGTFDLFAEIQFGVMQMDHRAWSSNTARATALTRKNGIAVLSGTPSMTYLGTVKTSGVPGFITYNDNESQRLVWNEHNQVTRPVRKYEAATSWTYSSAAWRPLNNSTANRIEVVDGLGLGVVDTSLIVRASPGSGTYAQIGIAIDSTNPILVALWSIADQSNTVKIDRIVGAGYHYLQAVEYVAGSGTVTYYSNGVSGLEGVWLC